MNNTFNNSEFSRNINMNLVDILKSIISINCEQTF